MTQFKHLLERFSTGFDRLDKNVTFVFGADRRVKKHNLARTEVSANKFLLSLASPVFDAMFNGPLREKSDRIYITDLKKGAFETMLE